MFDIDALIASAKQKLDTVKPVDQEVILGEKIVKVRFWPLSGTDWRNLTARHPWRDDSVQDQNLGYNIDGVTAAYPKVYLVDGDEVQDVSERWPEIAKVLSGPDLKNCGFAIWGLNEYDPEMRRKLAGKASKGGQQKKRRSPASTASPSVSSTEKPKQQ